MTTLTLTADPEGRRATLRSTSGLLRPMTLSCDGGSARVSLVPQSALLLAGDHVQITVDVGPGAHLEIVETSGTVAYDMRDGAVPTATWNVDIRIADGGSLRWDSLPFVVATGADVRRTTRIRLGADARLWLRETLVMGRTGETGGHVRSLLDVRQRVGEQTAPVLVEETDSADIGRRVLDCLLLIGHEVGPDHPGMRLEADGWLTRSLCDEAHQSALA